MDLTYCNNQFDPTFTYKRTRTCDRYYPVSKVEADPRLPRFTFRWTATWDTGAQSRLLWTGARCAIELYVSDISHSRSRAGQLSVLSLCGRNVQHVLQSFLRVYLSIWCTSVVEGISTHSLSCRICRSFSTLITATLLSHADLLRLQGCALIGLGSFFFHATLLYEAQLADELPMIYVASFFLAVLLESEPGFEFKSTYSKFLVAATVIFDVAFTAS